MCTFTVVALSAAGTENRALGGPGASPGSGFRVAFNRDESRRRPAGLPPVARVYGPRRALHPVDPVSGGTWIGVNDAGLALALLNVYAPAPTPRPPDDVRRAALPAKAATGRPLVDDSTVREWPSTSSTGRRSRGEIIPALLHMECVDEVRAALRRVTRDDYPPFRVVAIDDTGAIRDFYSDARELREGAAHLADGPVLFTSSGLGDGLVDPPRRQLFQELVVPASDRLAAQAAYHRHSWPDARHLSVCMSRPDARTVSHTTIEVMRARVAIEYWPDAPDQSQDPIRRTIPREDAV